MNLMLTRLTVATLACLCALSPLQAQTDATEAASALAPDGRTAALNAMLDRYVGRWVGKFEIRGMARVLQTIEVEQQYWWDEIDGIRVLKGQAVMAAHGELSTSLSRTYIQSGRIYSETDQEGREHFFVAKLSADGNTLSWLPADDADPLGRKLTDTFVETPEGTMLVVESYEEIPIDNEGNRAVLTMRGELKLVGNASRLQLPSVPSD